ncbi:MAG TPA: hypothetical protein VHC49_24905, partial [Mycobacteriales bacterium]|nr:hypothetical protein [Mycobacteriales bacterium]
MTGDAERLWSGSRWERRRAARRLAQARTPASVRALATAATQGLLAAGDGMLARVVRRAILRGGDPDLADAVWDSVLAAGDGLLAETVAAAGLEHSQAPNRAAAALLAGDVERYRDLDPAGTLLGAVQPGLGDAARAGLAERARAAGCEEWVRAVAGGSLTDAEWAAVVAILRERAQWEFLWRLTFTAPPKWAGPMLRALDDSGWESADPAYARLRERLNACAAVRPDGWVPAEATELSGVDGRVRRVAVTPDGRQVAASTGSAVHLWSLPSIEPRTLSREPLTAGRMLAVTGDGSQLAADYTSIAADPAAIARTWRLPSGAESDVVTAALDSVTAIAVTAGGRHVVAGDRTGAVAVCDLASGRTVGTLPGGGAAVSCVAATDDGDVVASGHVDGTVRVWSRVSGHVRSLRAGRLVQSVLLPPGGGIIAGADGRIIAWDLPGLPLTRRMRPRTIGTAPGSILVTPDGQLLLAGSVEGVRIWHLGTGEFRRLLPFQGAPAWHFTLLGRGRLLAGFGAGVVQLWRLPDGEPAGLLVPAGESGIERVAADAGGRTIVAAGDSLVVW